MTGKQMDIIVGIGEHAISNNKDDVIKTFALSSCVAITVYCPEKYVAGMAHIVLPASRRQTDTPDTKPYYYADTAVPKLINTICSQYGCNKNALKIQLFGGANSTMPNDIFQIGPKNLSSVKEILTNMGFAHDAAQTGGSFSRTIEMSVLDGSIKLTAQPLRL